MREQIVIFEELFHFHRWIVRWYVFRKKQVYFLRLHKGARQKKWVRNHCARATLKKLELNFTSWGLWDGMHFDDAFEHLDRIFDNVREKPVVKAVQKLYRTPAIELAYKMEMHQRMARFHYIAHVFDTAQKTFPGKEILFVPTNGVETFRTDGCEAVEFRTFSRMLKEHAICLFDLHQARIASWASGFGHVIHGLHMIKYFFMTVLFPFGVLFKIFSSRWRKGSLPERKNYSFAFHAFSIPQGVDNRVPKFDLLIDEDHIKSKESVFVSYSRLYGGVREGFAAKNAACVDDLNGLFDVQDFVRTFPAYLRLLASFLREEYFVFRTSLRLIYFYLRWSGFSKKISVRKLVSFCDFGIESVARNLILAQSGTRSYYYMDSANFGCFYSRNDAPKMYRGGIGYAYYDHFISWNDRVSDYFKGSKCQIKHYINVGCLLSEPIRRMKEEGAACGFKQELYRHHFKDHMKLVVVFDSTLSDDSISGYEEGIKFLEDILRLLADYPDIFVVVKEKKSRLRHSHMTERSDVLMDLYHAVEDHPRAFCVLDAFSPSEMIAHSDLTISFPFTSPTLEAVAARCKALWHDAKDQYRETYYDRIPGLVSHNYDELSARLNQLLFLVSEAEYNEYLDRHIKGTVEPYLDGKAVTRFRQYLLDGETVENVETPGLRVHDLERVRT